MAVIFVGVFVPPRGHGKEVAINDHDAVLLPGSDCITGNS
jgi:hypothetical protein